MATWRERLANLLRPARDRRPGTPEGVSPDEYLLRYAAWTKVDSSNVEAVAYYDPPAGGTGVLGVRFLSGATYAYYGVARDVYQAMLSAASKGKFVWRELRGRYVYKRIT